MTECAAVIAGGGPTGMMLAAELALAGVEAVIVERRTSQELDGSRAGGLHSRTIEILDQRGVADRFLAAGQTHPNLGYGGTFLDMADTPSRHNYLLALWQKDFEPILAEWVAELGVTTLRGHEVVGFTQHDDGVDVDLSDGRTLRGQYLVGCEGARSVVRKTAGIEFAGLDASMSWMIAEVTFDDDPQLGFHSDELGRHAIGPRGDGSFGVVLVDRSVERSSDATESELREALVGVYGTDFGLRGANWISRFSDMSRQAVDYRKGRVLLAGDAAHVHPPMGGQGLNTGVQDAVNLGWKLAQVVRGTSPEALLDTYHRERHPVGARVLHNTMAQVAAGLPDERHQALRDSLNDLLAMDEPRRHVVAMISGLDVHYDLGDGHPLLGRRMPDLDLETADGATTVFAFLHDARPMLLDLGASGGFDTSPWTDRVRLVEATSDGTLELPMIGEVAAPRAVLIRPDGYVAWVGDLENPELGPTIDRWFGAATP